MQCLREKLAFRGGWPKKDEERRGLSAETPDLSRPAFSGSGSPVESPADLGQGAAHVHLHILGICGTFMGGLARLAAEAGHRVSGCDAGVYPPMSEQLGEAGIEVMPGYDAGQLGLRPDMFVIGNVVARGNPLFEAILDGGAPFASGPQWLAQNVLAGRHVLAVAGTHGKTTTTTMLAEILQAQGLEPGFLIGGVPLSLGASARLGRGPFVIEADEYDSALFDKRSKFVHYLPRTVVLNNLEYDHADIFPDLAAIETQFHHLVRCVPGHGRIVTHGAEPALERVLARGCWTPVERLGVPGGWVLEAPNGARGPVRVLRDGVLQAEGDLPLAGAHNRNNALAALVAAEHLGITPRQSLASLARFGGVRRRMELRGEVGGVRVYDDFAHHPTAIRVTLQALRDLVGPARITVLLDPRSNTMRMGVLREALAPSLAGADRVLCYAPPGSLAWDPAAALQSLGARLQVHTDLDALVAAATTGLAPGEHLLAMSNGAFGGVHERLLQALRGAAAPAAPR
jgi:UDP-N-acetylmuramate: L-alanyl-gamma-D-glutamyl-meso-diaminopimelate ligase